MEVQLLINGNDFLKTSQDLRKLLKKTDDGTWLLIHVCQWLEGDETDEEFLQAVRNTVAELKSIGADELRKKLSANFGGLVID